MEKLLKPFFLNNNIKIIFSADNNYAPYLAVCLKSLIINANPNYNYDIVILDGGICQSDKEIIQGFIIDKENFHISYFNIDNFIQENKEKFYLSGHISFAAYYRLFVPKIFEDEKLLYIDCDTIINGDISELYFQNIEDKSLGVVNHLYNENMSDDFIEYMKNVLKLEDPNIYFNSGVLVMNNKKMQKENATERCLELLSKIKPKFWDQCILNSLFQDDIKLLDYRFNLQYYDFDNYKTILPVPSDIEKEVKNAVQNPVIVHFITSCKPWHGNNINFSEYFWKYAKLTPYYEKLKKNSIKYSIKNKYKTLLKKIFSVTNTIDKKFKVITILGISIKIKKCYHS